MFLMCMCALQGKSIEETRQKLEKDWFVLAKGAWSFWTVGHLVNFALVPHHWRVLYTNVLGVAWGTFLSRLGSQDEGDQVHTPIDWLYMTTTGDNKPFLHDNPTPALVLAATAWGGVAVASYASMGMQSVAWTLLGLGMVGTVGAANLGQPQLEEWSKQQREDVNANQQEGEDDCIDISSIG